MVIHMVVVINVFDGFVMNVFDGFVVNVFDEILHKSEALKAIREVIFSGEEENEYNEYFPKHALVLLDLIRK